MTTNSTIIPITNTVYKYLLAVDDLSNPRVTAMTDWLTVQDASYYIYGYVTPYLTIIYPTEEVKLAFLLKFSDMYKPIKVRAGRYNILG